MIWYCDSFLLFQGSFNCKRKKNLDKSWLCKKRPSSRQFFLLSRQILVCKKIEIPFPPFFYASQTCPWNWSCLAVNPIAIYMLPLFQALVWSRSRLPKQARRNIWDGWFSSQPYFGNYLKPNSTGGRGQIMPTI